MCEMWSTGPWKDGNECPAKVRVDNGRKPRASDREDRLVVQKACSQEEHCLSHTQGKLTARELFLTAPGSKSKCFTVGHYFHRSRVPLQPNVKLLKPTSSSQGAGACGIDHTARGCTPFSPV